MLSDPSGASVTVEYQNGRGSASPNTSSRIVSVSVAGNVKASFTYSSSLHLSQIEDASTGKQFAFAFNAATIAAPFGPSTKLPVASLASVQVTGDPEPYKYDYDGFGELAHFTNPHDFSLAWTYTSFTFAKGVTNREIDARTIKVGDAASAQTSRFTRLNSDSNLTAHSQLLVTAPNSTETFQFQTSGDAQQIGLPISRTVALVNSKVSSSQKFVWSTNSESDAPQLQSATSLEIDSTGKKHC